MYFAEIGKIPTAQEFNLDTQKPWGYNMKFINKQYLSWERFLNDLQKREPDLWALANKKEDPLAELRASTVEK
jgi:hypothetical protein